MTKIVLGAGHGINTAGKRCLKSIDKNETREWVLNDRIVDKVESKLANYDVEVLRVDDTTGAKDISLSARVNAANAFRADLYCSFHHNAGINGGSGGGLSVLTYDNRESLVKLRDELYTCLLNAGGIKGNRATPKYASSDLYVLKHTNMSAVLVEHGFMDSTVDTPIILTEEYAEKMANGWIKFFENYLGIKKKVTTPVVTIKPTTSTTVSATASNIKVGDVVNINNGSKYYNSTKIVPSWVIKKSWYVISVNGNRIVLGKSFDGKNTLNSALNISDLKVVTTTANTATPATTTATPKVSYYPKYMGTTVSITTALKSIGVDSSFSNRRKIAVANGIVKSSALYLGTSAQNSTMLKLLKKGELIKI